MLGIRPQTYITITSDLHDNYLRSTLSYYLRASQILTQTALAFLTCDRRAQVRYYIRASLASLARASCPHAKSSANLLTSATPVASTSSSRIFRCPFASMRALTSRWLTAMAPRQAPQGHQAEDLMPHVRVLHGLTKRRKVLNGAAFLPHEESNAPHIDLIEGPEDP